LLGAILGRGEEILLSSFNSGLVGTSLRDSFALPTIVVASCCCCIEEEEEEEQQQQEPF
jgi:hypothetical protein